ncbi:hypothetical protein GN244_ATG05993 [Phytophthora infestans]|uniref:Uncharacterized protein n=1 Tax=Phytophthora infestans TaxID=4787 RepID=A0A833SW99_PHYIN|nr:hypothetical protein GN244_ATG05992 [Phytophthora infestans]KAF4041778.1 hypothetical protein GN244_ATG05993 [Phytophthora infestans]
MKARGCTVIAFAKWWALRASNARRRLTRFCWTRSGLRRISGRIVSAVGSCSTATHRTISGRDIVRRCIACESGPKAIEFWEEKLPPPDSTKVRRQESLANVMKAMGPDWYPKIKKRRSRPCKLTVRNAKYIEEKKQQKSK